MKHKLVTSIVVIMLVWQSALWADDDVLRTMAYEERGSEDTDSTIYRPTIVGTQFGEGTVRFISVVSQGFFEKGIGFDVMVHPVEPKLNDLAFLRIVPSGVIGTGSHSDVSTEDVKRVLNALPYDDESGQFLDDLIKREAEWRKFPPELLPPSWMTIWNTRARSPFSYFILHKPVNVISQRETDPYGRKNIYEFLPRHIARQSQRRKGVVAVGRLDAPSNGLMLLTDDGQLNHVLVSPAFHIPRTYRVEVRGYVTDNQGQRLREGVMITKVFDVGRDKVTGRKKPRVKEPHTTQPADVTILSRHKRSSVLEITVREGVYREVRKMCAAVRHKDVDRLERIRFGPLELGDLKSGEWRPVTIKELDALLALKANRYTPLSALTETTHPELLGSI